MLFYVCFSLIVRDMLCVEQSEILFCDVQLYVFLFELVNWNSAILLCVLPFVQHGAF
jgi:hypothetical protein